MQILFTFLTFSPKYLKRVLQFKQKYSEIAQTKSIEGCDLLLSAAPTTFRPLISYRIIIIMSSVMSESLSKRWGNFGGISIQLAWCVINNKTVHGDTRNNCKWLIRQLNGDQRGTHLYVPSYRLSNRIVNCWRYEFEATATIHLLPLYTWFSQVHQSTRPVTSRTLQSWGDVN